MEKQTTDCKIEISRCVYKFVKRKWISPPCKVRIVENTNESNLVSSPVQPCRLPARGAAGRSMATGWRRRRRSLRCPGDYCLLLLSYWRTHNNKYSAKKQKNANDKNLGGAKMEEEKTIFLFCSKSPHPHWAVHWVADSKSLVVHLFEAKKRCSLDSTCSEDFVSAAWKMYLINLQNVFVSIANIFFCFQNIIYK